MHNLEGLKALLSEPKRIVIFPHQRPDADALGSSLGMMAYLQQHNHQVTVISPTEYPSFLKWMPQSEKVLIYSQQTTDKIDSLVREADLAICLDFSQPKRTAPLDSFLEKNPNLPIMLIDHHKGKLDFATYELWNPDAAATAELVYEFIGLMGDRQRINLPIAECLYAGIMTDTASFKHSNTTSKVHRIAADLIDLGVVSSKIQQLIYDSNSESRIRLLGYALSQCLTVRYDLRTAYFILRQSDTKKFNPQTGDTEGIVNYALSLKDIDFATILIDYGNEVRMSFRSVGNFSVADFAKQHFNGGGHHNAAGGRSQEPINLVIEKFESLIEDYRSVLVTS